MKIAEFLKKNISFQWPGWVPERPESGPRGHRNTPRAASEDQMDSWEVPGERPEAVWRRFGSSRGAFEAVSESRFRQKIIIWNFQSKRRDAECFSTRGNARSASLQTKFEKEAVDNAVDSAHTVCRPVRFAVSRSRFLAVGGSGRRPLEFPDPRSGVRGC